VACYLWISSEHLLRQKLFITLLSENYFQLDAILDPEKLSKEIHFLEKSLEYRVRTGDTEAKWVKRTDLIGRSFSYYHFKLTFLFVWFFTFNNYRNGLNFSMECKRRALKENQTFDTKDWSLSCKMKLLLQWARLVCAHYGLEVKPFFFVSRSYANSKQQVVLTKKRK